MIIAPHFLPRFQPTPSVDLRWNDYTTQQQPGWGQYKWVERDLFINVFTHIYVKSYATCLNRNLGMFCAGGLEQCKFMKHMVWYSRSRSQPRSLQIFFAIKQIQHWGELTLRALYIYREAVLRLLLTTNHTVYRVKIHITWQMTYGWHDINRNIK